MECDADIQEFLDRMYARNGPCCAGCDWWRYFNSRIGECLQSAPVSADERMAMIGIERCTMPIGAGHVITPYNHHCGDFRDDFDWSSLPLGYLKRIGRMQLKEGRGTS